MIITDVTTIKLHYDMAVPMADAIHYMPARPTLLVQIHTAWAKILLRRCSAPTWLSTIHPVYTSSARPPSPPATASTQP